MEAPTYTPPPPPPADPAIAEANARAQADQVTAAQQTAGIDSAALMARYGTTLALGGSSPVGSPLAPLMKAM